MIYLRMMETVECGVRDELRVKDVCDTLCDARIDLEDVTVSVPKEVGVYCVQAVSYTHLDVYKRQAFTAVGSGSARSSSAVAQRQPSGAGTFSA